MTSAPARGALPSASVRVPLMDPVTASSKARTVGLRMYFPECPAFTTWMEWAPSKSMKISAVVPVWTTKSPTSLIPVWAPDGILRSWLLPSSSTMELPVGARMSRIWP